MIICVDFDGTIVKHAYPAIGEPVPKALEYLMEFQKRGAQLILFTIRSGVEESAAAEYCRVNGIKLWGVNVNPTQHLWSQSRKVYAHLYIDDAAAGCPLLSGDLPNDRPYVNWDLIGRYVIELLDQENKLISAKAVNGTPCPACQMVECSCE
jgi:hypothetical protein